MFRIGTGDFVHGVAVGTAADAVVDVLIPSCDGPVGHPLANGTSGMHHTSIQLARCLGGIAVHGRRGLEVARLVAEEGSSCGSSGWLHRGRRREGVSFDDGAGREKSREEGLVGVRVLFRGSGERARRLRD